MVKIIEDESVKQPLTLLDLYTAGATEYVAVLFTTVFGSFGLLELAQEGKYSKPQQKRILSWVYLVVSGVAYWAVARIIGTEFLLVDELKAEGLYSQYLQQVSSYDPLAASRLVNLFVGPYFYVLYLGGPLLVFLIFWWVWTKLVYGKGLVEFVKTLKLRN